ncbi:TPA: hypothetical protein ACF2P6_002874, partial [Legionella pneumophila]
MNKLKTYRDYLIKKLILVLFLFVLVFIPIELFSRWVSSFSPASFGSGIRVDQKYLIADSINSGIVAIGDSIIARGFYPEIFSTSLANKIQ